jgi:hypothetical protein
MATHASWLAVVVCVPVAHGAHARSVVVLPVVLTNVPGAHVVHGVQLAAFAVVLNAPLTHAVHLRSLVAVPAVATLSPGEQSVQGTHAVAAFASLSHVPGGHGCFGDSPPAQYIPGSHDWHSSAAVVVGALTCSVPAGQAFCVVHAVWFLVDVYVPAAHAVHWRFAVAVPDALT